MYRNNDYNILLIDDELNILKLYSALLKRDGYQVSEFISADKALKFMKETEDKIDLIIADVNMPEMTGVEFLKKIKQNAKYSSVPLVFLSAIADSSVHVDAFELGAVDFFTKPVKKEIFLSKIKALLRSYALKTFRENIFLEGDQNEKSIDEIIVICEAEHFSGFTCVYNSTSKGVLHFKGGMLEEIECGKLKGPAAYEVIDSWKEYLFTAVHGPYDESVARQILSQVQGVPSEKLTNKEYPGPDRRKTHQITGAVECFHLSENGSAPRGLKYHNVYTIYSDFTKTVSKLIDQKLDSAHIEFTDQKVLHIDLKNDQNTAIMFDNKKSWRLYQRQNESK